MRVSLLTLTIQHMYIQGRVRNITMILIVCKGHMQHEYCLPLVFYAIVTSAGSHFSWLCL